MPVNVLKTNRCPGVRTVCKKGQRHTCALDLPRYSTSDWNISQSNLPRLELFKIAKRQLVGLEIPYSALKLIGMFSLMEPLLRLESEVEHIPNHTEGKST